MNDNYIALNAIPFLILLIVVMPLTKLLVGKSYGSTATIVPLTLAAAPLIGRMVESSLKEVNKGVYCRHCPAHAGCRNPSGKKNGSQK